MLYLACFFFHKFSHLYSVNPLEFQIHHCSFFFLQIQISFRRYYKSPCNEQSHCSILSLNQTSLLIITRCWNLHCIFPKIFINLLSEFYQITRWLLKEIFILPTGVSEFYPEKIELCKCNGKKMLTDVISLPDVLSDYTI